MTTSLGILLINIDPYLEGKHCFSAVITLPSSTHGNLCWSCHFYQGIVHCHSNMFHKDNGVEGNPCVECIYGNRKLVSTRNYYNWGHRPLIAHCESFFSFISLSTFNLRVFADTSTYPVIILSIEMRWTFASWGLSRCRRCWHGPRIS